MFQRTLAFLKNDKYSIGENYKFVGGDLTTEAILRRKLFKGGNNLWNYGMQGDC